jgi:hypothetical protein
MAKKSSTSNGIGSFVLHVALKAVKSAWFKNLLAKSMTLLEEQVDGKQIPLTMVMSVVLASFPLEYFQYVKKLFGFFFIWALHFTPIRRSFDLPGQIRYLGCLKADQAVLSLNVFRLRDFFPDFNASIKVSIAILNPS